MSHIKLSSTLNTAIRLLARREHSAQELSQKLRHKGFAQEEIRDTIHICQERNYLSDERFCEQFCRMRMQQGYGPFRIEQELQSRGVEAHIIERILHECAPHWENIMLQVVQKKTQGKKNLDLQAHAKLKRFLYSRGFPAELIHKI